MIIVIVIIVIVIIVIVIIVIVIIVIVIIVIIIIVIVIIVIVIIVIIIIVIVILVIVFLVMLVIVLKIMCILILMCVKKCLISFLEVEVLITVQGNGRIYLSARWNQVLILILHSWWLLRHFSNRLYLLLLASNGLCSIGSNRMVLPITKSVNAEETVRQASRASATNEDHIFCILKLWLTLWSQN